MGKIVKKLKKSKYEICLQYALSNKYIDKVIVGVDSSKQFKELVLSAKTLKVNIKSLDASNEIGLINPQNGKKVIAIVQARCSSVRLPNKVLKKINGIPLIEILYSRLIASKK